MRTIFVDHTEYKWMLGRRYVVVRRASDNKRILCVPRDEITNGPSVLPRHVAAAIVKATT